MGNRDEKWETNLEATETNQSRGEEGQNESSGNSTEGSKTCLGY